MELTCPQCNNVIKNSSLRLVQDSCGHKKCRGCLLKDEHECKLCVTENNYFNVQNSDELNIIHAIEPNQQTEQHQFVQLQNCIEVQTVSNVKNVDFKEEQIDYTDGNTKRTSSACLMHSHITMDEDCKYTCNICSRSFISKGYMKYHKYCANGGKRPYQCKNCPKSFINLSQLEVHELIHSNKKPFTCDICKKSFRQRSKLTRHRLLHNDKKMYNCEECDRAFKTKESLTSHIVTHTTDKPFTCAFCNASFNNSSNYKKHITIHTKDKPHMCDQCGKRFKLKWTLNIHKKIHMSAKPYRCTHCSKVFSYAKDLQRHTLIHMDRKAYACGSCSIEFRRKDNLERHIRNLHPGKQIPSIKKEIRSKQTCGDISNSNRDPPEMILPSEVPFVNFQKKNTSEIQTNILQESNNPIIDIPNNTPLLQRLDVVRDRPNAVTVIRAPPGILWKNRENRELAAEEKGRTEEKSAINAPLKLALKTNEFKNNYNIQSRNYVEPEIEQRVSVRNSSDYKIEERRAILTSYTAQKTSGLHYETSFDQEKHAIIKNIKFKLPAKYTNLKSKANLQEQLNYVMQNAESDGGLMKPADCMDLGQCFAQVTAATSVIVNTSDTNDKMA